MLDTYNFSIIIELCIIGVANIARLDCCQTFAGFSCAHKWNQAKTEDQANHIKCHEWLTYRPPCTAPHKSPGCQHDTPGTSNNAHIIIYCLGLWAPSTDTRLCRVPDPANADALWHADTITCITFAGHAVLAPLSV